MTKAQAAALAAFDDRVYLHQVVEKGAGGLARYVDLPDALGAFEAARGGDGGRGAGMAGAFPCPDLPGGTAAVRQHAGLSRNPAPPPPGTADRAAPGGRDLHLGCAAAPPIATRMWPQPSPANSPGCWSGWRHEARGTPSSSAASPTCRRCGPTFWPVSPSPAAGSRRLRMPVLAGLLIALSLAYVAGMYLNDAFDAAIDRRERPDRPIPSGRVARRTVFVAGFAMLVRRTLVLALIGARRAHRRSCLGSRSPPAPRSPSPSSPTTPGTRKTRSARC